MSHIDIDFCLSSYWIESTTICLLFIIIYWTIQKRCEGTCKIPLKKPPFLLSYGVGSSRVLAKGCTSACPRDTTCRIALLTLHTAEVQYFLENAGGNRTSFIMLHVISHLFTSFRIWMKSFFRGLTNLCHHGPSLRRMWQNGHAVLEACGHGTIKYTEALTSSGALPFSSDEGSINRFWREQVEHHQW